MLAFFKMSENFVFFFFFFKRKGQALLTLSPYNVPGTQMLTKHWMSSYNPPETEDPHSLSQSIHLLCEVMHLLSLVGGKCSDIYL